jgi:hypothetical protein
MGGVFGTVGGNDVVGKKKPSYWLNSTLSE